MAERDTTRDDVDVVLDESSDRGILAEQDDRNPPTSKNALKKLLKKKAVEKKKTEKAAMRVRGINNDLVRCPTALCCVHQIML